MSTEINLQFLIGPLVLYVYSDDTGHVDIQEKNKLKY